MSRGGISQFPTQYLAGDAPIGQISPWPGTTAPAGHLLCHGQAVSRTLYSQLFAVIGEAFGAGDGSTTFNVPDMRGRTWFGVDNLGGTDAGRLDLSNNIGTSGGVQKHTLEASEMPTHLHSIEHDHAAFNSGNQSANHTHAGTVLSGAMSGAHMTVMADVQAAPPGPSPVTAGVTANHFHQINVPNYVGNSGNAGSGGAHENMPPFLLGGWIIKAKYLSASVVVGLAPDNVTLEATDTGLIQLKDKPWTLPWGRVGQTEETGSNITVSANTAITVQSVDVDVVAGRRYRIEGFVKLNASGGSRKPLARLRHTDLFWDLFWGTIASGDNATGSGSYTYDATESKTETFYMTVQSTASGDVIVSKSNQWDTVRITVDDMGPTP